jgi:hypothetical protein
MAIETVDLIERRPVTLDVGDHPGLPAQLLREEREQRALKIDRIPEGLA